MSAYPESASKIQSDPTGAEGGILLCGLNWLGDSVMSLPAVLALKKAQPATRVSILVKPGLTPLWRMVPSVSRVIEIAGEGALGTFRTARLLRDLRFDRCFVLPLSFRSALIPYLAGIPLRIGMPGHCRDWMLTGTVGPGRGGSRHQMHEYFDLLGLGADGAAAPPLISVPADVTGRGREMAPGEAGAGALVAMFPGAAYGPSKRWPAARFAEVARRLAAEMKCRVVLLGSSGDAEVCEQVRLESGGTAASLAGRTSLPELAGVLSNCAAAIANDSGGMHLAAAVGVPVVGIFGITDPGVSGPIGPGHRIIAAPGVSRSRNLARTSEAATEALAAITPEMVFEAVAALVKEDREKGRVQ